MEPTDRSIPPVIMTKVMPTAVISRKALSINRFKNTWSEKKPRYSIEPAANITMNKPTVTKIGK
ncbi:hypothetical protein D3C86_2005110 [compost metagenome]